MKILKRIILWLLVLITLLIVVAYILPGDYKVERSTLINAEKDVVFSMVCDYDNWDYWTPWAYSEDTTVVVENIGRCEVGAVSRWDGKDMGKGEMIITELTPGERIRWEMGFEGFSQKMFVDMIFEQEGEGWLVTWTAEGELGYNPIYRYYGLMIDADIGEDYEKGLQQLKEHCEKLPDFPGIHLTELVSSPAIAVKDSVHVSQLGVFMETFFPQLFMYAVRQEASIAGHAYSMYYNWDPEGMILVEVGVPLSDPLEGEGTIMSSQTPAGKAVKAVYVGPYEEMAPVYDALLEYISVMKYEAVGPAYEVYVISHDTETDPAKFETHIYFPVK